MNFSSALDKKQFYRFTGPPEHWLTAIKYMTWGLEERYRSRWEKIQTGDIFFIHSTAASDFSNATSGIIGIGVVGFNFSTKNNYLWRYELTNKENRWPLLVPLTEIYLFSELPDPTTWESPTPNNDVQTGKLIEKLLKDRVPLSSIKGFPQMGSFSSVSREVADQILFYKKPLYLYSGHSERGTVIDEPSNFMEVKNAPETLRHTASLRFVESIKERIILKPNSLVERDNDILARAEKSHYSISKDLISIFRSKGYDTFVNNHVDLFAHNKSRSYLIEVKSTENRNFRTQARKAIAQLYEYDYFDISKYKKEKEIDFAEQYRIFVPSRESHDTKYVNFINFLDLGVGTVKDNTFQAVGKDFGISKI